MRPIGANTRIDIGTDVVGSDGNKVGTVAYVVVRPPEMRITDIVVSTRALLGRDVVVPLDGVRRVEDGKVFLSIDRDRLTTYPDYIEVKFQQPPAGWVPPAELYYPQTGILWTADADYPEASSIQVNAPSGTVGISEGMGVESSDGHTVGTVDALEIDPTSNEVTAFVVKHGFLFTHDTRLPVTDTSEIRDGKVVLTLTRDQVQKIENPPTATGRQPSA